ncbi:MAG TPA: hypothetical protein PKW82_07490 [Spirochaetales bacterium]|nr:hypothetical protein [Spirochaetales bacterium]
MAAQKPDKGAERDQGAEPGLAAKLNDFLRRNRVAAFAVLVTLVVGIAGVAVWSVVSEAADAKAALAVEAADASFAAWTSAPDAAAKSDLEATLRAELEALSARYGTDWPGLHAELLAARMVAEAGKWAEAESLYAALARKAPATSHVGPAAYRYAADAAERAGANDRAATLLNEFLAAWEGKAPGAERAHLALLRLAEAVRDYAAAREQYEVMVSRYPDSDWTKLAANRILYLESQGLLD